MQDEPDAHGKMRKQVSASEKERDEEDPTLSTSSRRVRAESSFTVPLSLDLSDLLDLFSLTVTVADCNVI